MHVEIWYTTPDDFGKAMMGKLLINRAKVMEFESVEAEMMEPELFLERLFRAMNVVLGKEFPTVIGVRSMSVGDAVIFKELGFGPRGYVCMNAGWKRFHVTNHGGQPLLLEEYL